MYKHILISSDGSELGQKGVDHGLSLARALGARVTILTVTERFPIYPDGLAGAYAVSEQMIAEYNESQAGSANAILSAAKQTADRLGVAADTLHVPNAQPAEAIVETATARNCDLVAMASHGRRGLQRLVLGSVTSEVLAHSPVPVLVVR